MLLASAADRFTPLCIAAILCWILCVCVHEFSHALVAYWGGDRSVKEKGYLTLDPTRFIDPVFSLLVPAIVLAMGGLPLPGGSVMIDVAALRSRRWQQYMSAAGPASNFLLFLIFGMFLHPVLGLVNPNAPDQPTWVYFLGAMAFLNFYSTLFNLLPVPPFDGYHIIQHRFPYEMQWKLAQPQVAIMTYATIFFLFQLDAVQGVFLYMLVEVCDAVGIPIRLLFEGYNLVLFNRPPS
jgi:Zn-dependent protease